jgi:hypothetical protein
MSSLDANAMDSSPLNGFYSWTDSLKGVYYGPGSTTTALPKLLNTLGVKKALIVTGRSLNDKASILNSSDTLRYDTEKDECREEGRSHFERARCLGCHLL